MDTLILTFTIFVVTVATGLVGYSLIADLFFAERNRINRRIDDKLRDDLREQAEKSPLFRNLGQMSSDARDAGHHSFSNRLNLTIEQSGLKVQAPQLFLMSGICGVALGLGGGFATRNVIVGVVSLIIGAALPFWYVCRARKLRQNKLLAQLPDAFDLMARTVRAGNSFWQSVQSVAEEFEQPLALELAYCHEMQHLGLPTEVALREFGRRTGLVEIKILVEAVTVQQQTGGNLGEILDKLNHTVRERFRIWGSIKTLTAESSLQALVLLALAPAMYGLLLFLNYDYARILMDWNHSALLIGALTCEGLGWLWIRKIVNFDF